MSVENQQISTIGKGLLVFVGVSRKDTSVEVDKLARKLLELRIFQDEQGKLNLSVQDIKGDLLVVSQFTLYADCHRGRRPDFIQAASPVHAEELYDKFVKFLRESGLNIQTGEFAAYMKVHLVNDGPLTIWLSSDT